MNKHRVSFVSNLLSQDGFLCTSLNKDESRILISRGPVRFKSEMIKKGSIFLFSDVLILAKCVVAKRYIGEISLKLNSEAVVAEKIGTEIVFTEHDKLKAVVEFEDESLAIVWDKYIQFARSRLAHGHKGNVSTVKSEV